MRRFLSFESKRQPVASRTVFYGRLARNALYSVCFVSASLFVGSCGYVYFENMRLVDAFANAAMILSGMGPLTPLMTDGGKIFASFYALFSGLLVIGTSSLMLAPVFHRVLHRFHVDEHDADPPRRKG